MSSNKYWEKVNLNILNSLGEEIDSDVKNGKYLEAVMLQFCLIETELRYCILRKIERFPQAGSLTKYYSSEMANFAALIDYLELLQGEPQLVSSLRTYNASRVEIVHRVMFFNSIAELQKKAETTYKVGTETLKLLVAEVNSAMQKLGYRTVEDTVEFAEKNGLLDRCKNCAHIRAAHINTPNLQESDRKKTIEELSQRCIIKECTCLNFVAPDRDGSK